MHKLKQLSPKARSTNSVVRSFHLRKILLSILAVQLSGCSTPKIGACVEFDESSLKGCVDISSSNEVGIGQEQDPEATSGITCKCPRTEHHP